MEACNAGSPELVEALLKKDKTLLSKKSTMAAPPLYHVFRMMKFRSSLSPATRRHFEETAEALVAAGADANEALPADVAIYILTHEFPKAFQDLLKDQGIKNLTLLELAILENEPEAVEWLRKKGVAARPQTEQIVEALEGWCQTSFGDDPRASSGAPEFCWKNRREGAASLLQKLKISATSRHGYSSRPASH